MASADGVETSDRPPQPGKKWSYAEKFYRADLQGFTSFDAPINLSTVFALRQAELMQYFAVNKARRTLKQNIFFVRQSGRLQCQNGAYLSDVDDELFSVIFGITLGGAATQDVPVTASVKTSQQLAEVQRRTGQSAFSRELKKLYGNRCCFRLAQFRCSISGRLAHRALE